jgi:hypothetical protein
MTNQIYEMPLTVASKDPLETLKCDHPNKINVHESERQKIGRISMGIHLLLAGLVATVL